MSFNVVSASLTSAFPFARTCALLYPGEIDVGGIQLPARYRNGAGTLGHPVDRVYVAL